MTKPIETLIANLKVAAQEEIMFRESGDTSDRWQDDATPENVLRLVEALSAKQAEPVGWIKCSDKLPDDARDVTLMSKEHGVVNGYYWSGKHWGKDVKPEWFVSCGTHEGSASDITHWMPLPAAPTSLLEGE